MLTTSQARRKLVAILDEMEQAIRGGADPYEVARAAATEMDLLPLEDHERTPQAMTIEELRVIAEAIERPAQPRVYLAHPVSTYGTDHAGACLAMLTEALPGAELLDPEVLYVSNDDWRQRWPRILPTLSALVVFGDRLGAVGTGCLQEITDAIYAGLSVAALDPAIGLVELVGFELVAPDLRSPSRAALLVFGQPVNPLLHEKEDA